MSSDEDQLRAALGQLAAEAKPAPLLMRLDATSHGASAAGRRRRAQMLLLSAAVLAALVMVTASVVVLRSDPEQTYQPTMRPAQVVRLSHDSSPSLSAAVLAVALTTPSGRSDVYLLPPRGSHAVLGNGDDSGSAPVNNSLQLSADGTMLVRQYRRTDMTTDVRLTDLVGDQVADLGTSSLEGECPQLAADASTLVMYDRAADLVLVDVATGDERLLRRGKGGFRLSCSGLGWSPDGALLVIREGRDSVVLDRTGRVRRELPARYAVNASLSWSPDGTSLLVYASVTGRYLVADVENGAQTELTPPTGAVRPIGWAGSEVIWLVGSPGDLRLVATGVDGSRARTWIELDIGERSVESISWSAALSGAPMP